MENGTIVWLKSGGPAMTVSNKSTGGVVCVWFVEKQIYKSGFSVESLTTEEPN